MVSSNTSTHPGTIDDAVAHLVLWGRRPGTGLARVDFVSDHAAGRCIQQLRQKLSGPDLPFHEFRLPVGLTVARLARLWIDKLSALDGGVVSVTGFADVFSAGPDLEEDLLKLNYYRERLAELPVRQIWWMPIDFADRFLRAAPDLNSWFTKRLRLEERVEGKTFFISHSDADRAWAEWIAWQLEDVGYARRLQAWHFRPGTDFVSQMQQVVADADHTIAVVSPSYLDSKFALSEWQAALAKDVGGEVRKLIPVRVEKCPLPPLLKSIAYINLAGLDETAARRTLLEGIQGGDAQPETAPPFLGRLEHAPEQPPRFPGLLPRVWNVSHPRNPNFVGRDELLAHLRSTLLSGKAAALVQAITGLGGVGKTEAAVEYAYRHADDYDVVWWVRADQPATLASDFAALAEPLNLPEKYAQEQERVIEAVRQWLQASDRWLLVFDNVVHPSDLDNYLPHGATGQVLVTSRNPNWKGKAAQLHVELFRREESVEFLLQRVGRTDRDSPQAEIEAEREAAEWLAHQLGDLPLPLALATAYIQTTGTTIKKYLRLFQESLPGLLTRKAPPGDYHETVAVTFSLNIEQARKKSEHVESLLNLCAFLAPDDIPVDMLLGGDAELSDLPGLAPLQDELARNHALAALRQYSLLERADDTVSVHRLVQAVTDDRLSEEDRTRWTTGVVRLLNDKLATSVVDTDLSCWPIYARLLPHALAGADHAENLNVRSDVLATLLDQIALYLHIRARFGEAEPLYRRALAIREKVLGLEHPDVATSLNNLAELYRNRGQYAEAEPLYQQALAIFEKVLGSEHPDVASSLNNLAGLYDNQGQYAEAEPLYRRALAIREKVLGPEHPDVAQSLNNLAGLYDNQGQHAEAEPLYQQALAIFEKVLGSEHPDVATSLNNLAELYRNQGQYAEAEPLYRRALAILEKVLGPEHPDVATCLKNYATSLRATDRIDEAVSIESQVAAIQLKHARVS